MIKSAVFAAITTAAALGAGSAHAGVHWSVGIGLPVPVVGAVAYPAYSAPAPVVYAAPAPVYVAPRVIYAPRYYYDPRPVYYRPAPVVYGGYGYYRGWHHGWR